MSRPIRSALIAAVETGGEAIVVPPDEGPTIPYAGETVRVLCESGGFAMVETTVSAGFGGPPPHRHHDFDEALYVLEGTLSFTAGIETLRGAPGTFVLVPRGLRHTFANPGDVTARMLGPWSPTSALEFFREIGRVLPASGPPDLAAVAEVYRRHNSELAP